MATSTVENGLNNAFADANGCEHTVQEAVWVEIAVIKGGYRMGWAREITGGELCAEEIVPLPDAFYYKIEVAGDAVAVIYTLPDHSAGRSETLVRGSIEFNGHGYMENNHDHIFIVINGVALSFPNRITRADLENGIRHPSLDALFSTECIGNWLSKSYRPE